MNAVIFARVSTAEQMREGHSIPAQIATMREYCARRNLLVVAEYEVDESSTKDERIKFQSVIKQIEAAKQTISLIIETIDRLQRGFRESVILGDLRQAGKVEIHFIREGLVISKDSNSADLLRWDMGVLFAKSYVTQLSDNVKRSIQEKLRTGQWPGKAPYGYTNVSGDDGKRTIIVAPFESRMVQKAFDLYSTRSFSLERVREALRDQHGVEWSKGKIDQMLKDRFYIGLMTHRGKTYPHRYDHLISVEQFNLVQEIRSGFRKKPVKFAGLPYLYRGIIKCGHCGHAITPEKHKGYVYYHCTQYSGKHGASWIREEELTMQFTQIFERVKIPDDVLQEVIKVLKHAQGAKMHLEADERRRLIHEQERIIHRKDRLYMDKLDGSITTAEYDKFYARFQAESVKIEARLDLLRDADDAYYNTATQLLKLAQCAPELFARSELQERRELIQIVLSNLRLFEKKLAYDAVEPFASLMAYNGHPEMLPRLGSNQRPSD